MVMPPLPAAFAPMLNQPYIVDDGLIRDFRNARHRLEAWPVVRVLWRGISPLLLVACYLGAFVATIYIELAPFVFAQNMELSDTAKLRVGVISLAVILLLMLLAIRRVVRFWQARCIELSQLMFITGSIFACWFIVSVLSKN